MAIKDHDELIKEQKEYYSAQANEYDQWFLRKGRFDKGPERNALWFNEVEIIRQALAAMAPMGRVLELACGTGLWTEQLAKYTDMITSVDASAEMIAKNKERMGGMQIDYIQADLFTWESEEKYDLVFFGFWMSHVPPGKFKGFWERVSTYLAPNGRVFFIDTLYNHDVAANDQHLRGQWDTVVRRTLNDGSEFEIIKVFYDPPKLEKDLRKMGWDIEVNTSGKYFLYGSGKKE